VVAGCGGAGASVLACALARRAGADHSTVLVDADPLGGGLDLVLGAEQVPGPRWTDLSASRGQLRPSTLADALPRHDGLALLSWGRDDTVDLDPDVFDDFLAAAGQAFDLVIVDLPRHAPPQWTRRCHHVLLVSPARVRSAVAASQVAKRPRHPRPARPRRAPVDPARPPRAARIPGPGPLRCGRLPGRQTTLARAPGCPPRRPRDRSRRPRLRTPRRFHRVGPGRQHPR